MSISCIIPHTTKNGVDYVIVFTEFKPNSIPVGINIPVVDVTIETNVEYADIKNTAGDLIQITNIISEYASKHNALFYCMCSDKPINKSTRKQGISNQEFRSDLFETMFNKHKHPDYINKVIVIKDPDNSNHYIHLISHIDNQEIVNLASKELIKFDKIEPAN